MARVRGKDLIIDALETVHALEATVRHLEVRFEVMADLQRDMRGQLHDLRGQVDGLQQRVAEFGETLGTFGGALDAYDRETASAAQLLRTQGSQLAQLARLFARLAQQSDERFEETERRLAALERSR